MGASKKKQSQNKKNGQLQRPIPVATGPNTNRNNNRSQIPIPVATGPNTNRNNNRLQKQSIPVATGPAPMASMPRTHRLRRSARSISTWPAHAEAHCELQTSSVPSMPIRKSKTTLKRKTKINHPRLPRDWTGMLVESADLGLRYSTKGRKPTSFYKCGTLFCDHGSKLIYLVFQLSTNAKETITSKREYESFCKWYNRTVESYCTDNGVFTSKEFTNDLTDSNQHHTVCGVGAHWQNSIAETCIGHIQNLGRTMLLHGISMWLDKVTVQFWTFALRHAVMIVNYLYVSSKNCSKDFQSDDTAAHQNWWWQWWFNSLLLLNSQHSQVQSISKS